MAMKLPPMGGDELQRLLQQGQAIQAPPPPSGWVCPNCNIEAPAGPPVDGQPAPTCLILGRKEDGIEIKRFYCVGCVQGFQQQYMVNLLMDNLPPLVRKVEVPGGNPGSPEGA